VQRAPEWFMGNSEGWIDVKTGKPGPVRNALTLNGPGMEGIAGQVTLRDSQVLKASHDIDASQIIKAALAIVITQRTKQKYALLGQTQAGRTWPFMLPWQANRMPLAMDVEGPALYIAIDKVPVQKSEKVLEMLTRLQAEQRELSRHAHAPMKQIVAALNGYETECEVPNFDGKVKGSAWLESQGGAGDFIRDVIRRQVFNWLPASATFEFKRLQMLDLEFTDDSGLLWNCSMSDQNTVLVNPHWDDAQLTLEEVKSMLDEILELAEKLAMEENWSKKLEELI